MKFNNKADILNYMKQIADNVIDGATLNLDNLMPVGRAVLVKEVPMTLIEKKVKGTNLVVALPNLEVQLAFVVAYGRGVTDEEKEELPIGAILSLERHTGVHIYGDLVAKDSENKYRLVFPESVAGKIADSVEQLIKSAQIDGEITP